VLSVLAPICLSVATVLGCLLLSGKDARRGREVIVMVLLCIAFATLGLIGEMA
jgi:hypothetical protein